MVGAIEKAFKSSLAKTKRRKSKVLLAQKDFGGIQQAFLKNVYYLIAWGKIFTSFHFLTDLSIISTYLTKIFFIHSEVFTKYLMGRGVGSVLNISVTVVNKTDQDPFSCKAYLVAKDNVLKDEKDCGKNCRR